MPAPRTNSRRGLYHALRSAPEWFLSRLSSRTRFIVSPGGALVLAAVLLAVFLTRPDASVRQASAEGLPIPAGAPQAATPSPCPHPRARSHHPPDIARIHAERGDES